MFLFAGNFLPSSNTGVEGESKCEDEEDTWIFPSIQMGAFDVRHDSDLTQRFLQSSSEVGTKFKFATMSIVDNIINRQCPKLLNEIWFISKINQE